MVKRSKHFDGTMGRFVKVTPNGRGISSRV